MKLTRATVPMCPECGESMTRYESLRGQRWICSTFRCVLMGRKIGGPGEMRPDWGYYAPDVEGVVREMRTTVYDICARSGEVSTAIVADWVARLEGTNE